MDIKSSLVVTNPWWNNEEINKQFLLGRKRNEFDDILEKIQNKRILSIIGPRRVGKSTLIYQTINYLLHEKNVEAERILLFSGDDPSLFFDKNDKLSDVLDVYFNEILEENISKLTSKVYIFIDEIHFIKNWQNFLKIYFDRKYNIKFIITGSSSMHLFKDANESLLGRIENIYVLPLTFNQFMNFYMTYISKDEDIIIPKIDLNNMDKSIKELEKIYYNQDLKIKIQKILKRYILVGGYPEYFEIKDIDVWQRQLTEDIITRGIYKDILTMYNIKSPEVLEKLLYYISANNSQTFAYSSIASTFGIDTVTIMTYLGYLKQAFLINILENYSNNIAKVIRTNKKLSILDNGIQNSLLKRKEVDNDMAGHIVESMVDFDFRLLCEKDNHKEFYFRNSDKEEIDVIIDRNIDIIPIEVKYTNQIEKGDLDTILNFLASHSKEGINQAKFGIIVTKDVLKKDGNLYFIPYWLLNI
ncbi:MAG: ATP-binding protein [Clostridia bacterium]|nr:ATP-binding protein [Clostridia bacterium]